MGHIRALKQDLDAVGIERSWAPAYESISTKASTIKQLKAAAADAEEVILATDDDREGEGIAFHICAVLKLNPLTTKRIIFHAITKPAIQKAISEPRLIDMNKFAAQQTRAQLDMLIGYTLSPVLWAQLNANGLPLSAGRCQTPALKLVLDRDKEIETHAAKRFWALSASFVCDAIKIPVDASRSQLQSDTETEQYLQPLTKASKSFLKSMKESVRTHNAPKPLITSTLQQEASKLYNMNPKATMASAQKLYEGGHITYMRTDNAFLSHEGAQGIRKHIEKSYGQSYLGPVGQHCAPPEKQAKAKTAEPPEQDTTEVKQTTKAKTTKTTKKEQGSPEAQAAHEAIRPTHPETTELEGVDPTEAKIYKLIWIRAFQSQMAAATEDCRALTFTIEADQTQTPWLGEQLKSKFQGWKVLTASAKAEEKATEQNTSWDLWAKVAQGQAAAWLAITAEEGFTKPHARYTEASLIHELETKGIGRPSTFASLVTTIVERNYVEKSDAAGSTIDIRKWLLKPQAAWPPNESTHKQVVGKESNKLQTTALGRTVAEFLYNHYADLFAYNYTAQMEQTLDNISKGTQTGPALLQTNWDLYKDRYKAHLVKKPKSETNESDGRKRVLGDGIVVILSRKGPLLLKEATTEFASLPPHTSFDTVTLAQALDAYELKDGTAIGTYEGSPINKKKGPYGFYAQHNSIKVPFKAEDTLESIIEKIKQKTTPQPDAYERKVGDYTIKRGPYGLYFFKHTLKKAVFVSWPTGADENKVTTTDMPALYAAAQAAKKPFASKAKAEPKAKAKETKAKAEPKAKETKAKAEPKAKKTKTETD
jgi:DNA topoisomerase-1